MRIHRYKIEILPWAKWTTKISKCTVIFNVLLFTIALTLSIGGCAFMDIKTGNGIIEHVGTIQNMRRDGTENLSWHPDSRHLIATTDYSKYIYIWDTMDNLLVTKIDTIHSRRGSTATYSLDGNYLISKHYPPQCKDNDGRHIGCLAIWSVKDNYRLIAQSEPLRIGPLAPTPDNRIFSFHQLMEPKMMFIEIPSFKQFESHFDLNAPDSIAFSHNGKLMAEGYKTLGPDSFDPSDNQYHLRMWKYPEMELLWEKHDVHNGNIRSIVFSNDNNIIVTGPYSSDEKFIKKSNNELIVDKAFMEPMKVWDANTGNFIRNFISLGRTPKHLWFIDDRHILSVTKINREIIIWDFISGKELDRVTIAKDNFVFNAALSPDKKTLAFGKMDKVLLFQFNFPQNLSNAQ